MKSQLQFIEEHLNKHGFITRNFCLRRRITRLQARIFDLKCKGYVFSMGYMKNGDYRYVLISKPRKK